MFKRFEMNAFLVTFQGLFFKTLLNGYMATFELIATRALQGYVCLFTEVRYRTISNKSAVKTL